MSSFIKISIDIAALVIIYFVFLLKKWRAKGGMFFCQQHCCTFIFRCAYGNADADFGFAFVFFSIPIRRCTCSRLKNFFWDMGQRAQIVFICQYDDSVRFPLPIVKKRRLFLRAVEIWVS